MSVRNMMGALFAVCTSLAWCLVSASGETIDANADYDWFEAMLD